MEQNSSSTSSVRVMVLCLALFALFVIAPAAFLSQLGVLNAGFMMQGNGICSEQTIASSRVRKKKVAGTGKRCSCAKLEKLTLSINISSVSGSGRAM